MDIVFAAHPFSPRAPEPAFEAEAQAAREAGHTLWFVDFEALFERSDVARATRWISTDAERPALYRGWMLSGEHYGRLFDALAAKGLRLLNDRAAYEFCHYLPNWYSAFEDATPQSVWLAGESWSDDALRAALATFGGAAVIVKDFVKSQKHYWHEACFIPDASDFDHARRVIERFCELQRGAFNRGLVLRRFERLRAAGRHPVSGMPLSEEVRGFFMRGAPLLVLPYWGQPAPDGALDLPDNLLARAAGVPSAFFTLDVARREDGSYLIVELGDGQVAGLPERVSPGVLFAGLRVVGG